MQKKEEGEGEKKEKGAGQTAHQPALKGALQYVNQSLRESDVRLARRSERRGKNTHTLQKERGKKRPEIQRVSGPAAGRVERERGKKHMQRPPANQRAAPVANAERGRPISGGGAFFDGWARGDEEGKAPNKKPIARLKGRQAATVQKAL